VHPHIRIAKVGIFYPYTSTVRNATAVSSITPMTSESSGIRQQKLQSNQRQSQDGVTRSVNNVSTHCLFSFRR
jgi:hypothetical protein